MSVVDARPGRLAVEWAVARRVPVGRWEVRYREAGRGPPVVLVHGLGVSNDYWWRVGPPLAERGYRVLAPDLPGFGRTAGPRRGLSVLEQAEAVAGFAAALELGPAVLVGHSLSCQALLELAATRPELAAGLVLASPTGAPGRFRLLRQAWGLLLDVPRESLPLAALVAQAYLRAGLPRIWRTWRLGAEEDPLPAAARVRCPALVVLGGRDPVVPLSFVRALTRALPRGRLALVRGAAHAVNFSGAGELVRLTAELAAAAATG